MTEIWAPFPSDHKFSVSNFGRVKNVITGNIRKPSNGGAAYQVICAGKRDGKNVAYYVHAMVLEAFIGARPKGMTCSHLNGNRKDNRLDNLIYESLADNIKRKIEHGTENFGEKNGSAKLTSKDVDEIRRDVKSTHKKLAEKYSVSFQQISRVRRGDNWVSDVTT